MTTQEQKQRLLNFFMLIDQYGVSIPYGLMFSIKAEKALFDALLEDCIDILRKRRISEDKLNNQRKFYSGRGHFPYPIFGKNVMTTIRVILEDNNIRHTDDDLVAKFRIL